MKTARTTGQVNASYTVFLTDFEKMTVDERDITNMIAEVETTSWRLRETVRVRELAATHRMRRLLMLEEKKSWKREVGFDRIETAAKMDAQRFRTNLVSEPFFDRNMFNPGRPHTPEEFTFGMRVDVKRLRMEIILSQPAPRPQCDPSPRRLPAVDTGSEEPGTPRRSPAIGTGPDEPEVSRAETSTDKEEIVPIQASVGGFLRLNRTSPEQECILFQPEVGVDNSETTTQQAATREEFARPTKKRQQQGMTAWSTKQSKQFDRGRSAVKSLLF